MRIKNQTSHISFFNYFTKNIQNNIWGELSSGLWKDFNIDAYLKNDFLPPNKLEQSLRLFPNFHQIEPGLIWDKEQNKLVQNIYVPTRVEGSINNLLMTIIKILEKIDYKRIGVHLSGGLDSSIIMSILHHLNIEFVAIGFKSSSYEFRTERKIQEYYLELSSEGELINIDDFPFYSGLDKLEKSQIPSYNIKSNVSSKIIAQKFKKYECDLVFTGLGGDTLFVNPISNLHNTTFNIESEFLMSYEEANIYKPLNIKLLSLFAFPQVIDIICSAREGQKLDPQKIWIRKWLKDLLPNTLVEYQYCSDYFGLSLKGLEQAKPIIKLLMEETYDLTHNERFSPGTLKDYFKYNVFSFEYSEYIRFCSLVSIAVWYHSLFSGENEKGCF